MCHYRHHAHPDPFYLPGLEGVLGRSGAPIALLLLGAALVLVGAARGPRLSPEDCDADIDAIATAGTGRPSSGSEAIR